MKSTTMYLLLTISILSFSCSKDITGTKGVSGTLKDYTGLDGCGWVIVLDKADADGTSKLEPTNLDKFNIKLSDGQRVSVSYRRIDGASICMVGAVAEIISLREEQ